MSIGGRAQLRNRNLRWAAIVAVVLVLLALLLLASGHWIVGILFGVVAAVAVFAFVQMRTVR
jgi:glucan phosphoethanolaminetransferase (alkaline phosphatase superfamily)